VELLEDSADNKYLDFSNISMLILSLAIAIIQAVWIVAVLLWGWYYWKIYKSPSSVAVLIGAAVALFLFGLSMLSPFVSRALSFSLSFLLISLCAWNEWSIHQDRKWIAYTILFCCVFALMYCGFAFNIKLSIPLNEWPTSNYLWALGVTIVGIGFLVEL
jgi:hypothetical protein